MLSCSVEHSPSASDPFQTWFHDSSLNDPYQPSPHDSSSNDPYQPSPHDSSPHDPFQASLHDSSLSDPFQALFHGSSVNDPYLNVLSRAPYLPWSTMSVDVAQAYVCSVPLGSTHCVKFQWRSLNGQSTLLQFDNALLSVPQSHHKFQPFQSETHPLERV
ncbi:hypothetical protein D3C71_1458540 [compost metagenome]